MNAPSRADLFRLLWRLPVWEPMIRLLERGAGSLLPANRVAAVESGGAQRPLDAFVAQAPKTFCAGAAAVDITPRHAVGANLAGFDFERTCVGVRDPLFARALLLWDGARALVIVTLDLIGLSRPRTERIRALVSDRFADAVILTCTHNHQGPDTLGLWGKGAFGVLPWQSGQDPRYMAQLEDGILAAVRGAIAAARPARLILAAGEFDRAGRWVHNERGPIVDRRLRVMSFVDERERHLATLAQYACHPETLWSENRLMSADFCGVCCRVVERHLGGVGLYANGALGAMVTAALPHQTPFAQREAHLEGLGRSLGQAVVRLARKNRDQAQEQPQLHIGRSEFSLPVEDNRLYQLLHVLGVVEDRDLRRGLISEVALARLGAATIACLPGEAAPALGLELLDRLPGQPRFLFGLAGDELGYLLPPEYFHDRRYAYEATMNPGPQAAVRLALALENLAARMA